MPQGHGRESVPNIPQNTKNNEEKSGAQRIPVPPILPLPPRELSAGALENLGLDIAYGSISDRINHHASGPIRSAGQKALSIGFNIIGKKLDDEREKKVLEKYRQEVEAFHNSPPMTDEDREKLYAAYIRQTHEDVAELKGESRPEKALLRRAAYDLGKVDNILQNREQKIAQEEKDAKEEVGSLYEAAQKIQNSLRASGQEVNEIKEPSADAPATQERHVALKEPPAGIFGKVLQVGGGAIVRRAGRITGILGVPAALGASYLLGFIEKERAEGREDAMLDEFGAAIREAGGKVYWDMPKEAVEQLEKRFLERAHEQAGKLAKDKNPDVKEIVRADENLSIVEMLLEERRREAEQRRKGKPEALGTLNDTIRQLNQVNASSQEMKDEDKDQKIAEQQEEIARIKKQFEAQQKELEALRKQEAEARRENLAVSGGETVEKVNLPNISPRTPIQNNATPPR